ncbi:MAG: EamA family transporter, partial [Chloroflexi bacterium]
PLGGYPPQTYLVFALNALIPQIIGYFSLTYAQGHLPAWIVSPTMIMQPVLTALLAFPLMGEALGLTQVIGGAAVVGGIYLINQAKDR